VAAGLIRCSAHTYRRRLETSMGRILSAVRHEFRDAVAPFVFFFIAFHMIAITKTVILESYTITATTATISTVAALIVAKAILVLEHVPIIRWFSARTLANVVWRTLLFALVAMLFRVIEEWIDAAIHREDIVTTSEQMIGRMTLGHFLVTLMWLFASIFLYCLCTAFVRALGSDRARRMLFGPMTDEPGGKA
jgi:hypothetical protein